MTEDQAATAFFGHHVALKALFFTEMWERFAYYGLKSVLVLYMVAAVADGGLGLTDTSATAIYGLYISGSFLLAIPGGWIADRVIGAYLTVVAGAVAILVATSLLLIPDSRSFFTGLFLLTIGTGLLKPNISVLVASLYAMDDGRRDAGFSIFYSGIYIGALIGSLLVPLTAQRFGWHSGFGLATGGMLLGLAYLLKRRSLLAVRAPMPQDPPSRGTWIWLWTGVSVICTAILLAVSGIVTIDPAATASIVTIATSVLAVIYFLYLFAFAGLTRDEVKRMVVILFLFVGVVIFVIGLEQGGATLNLFAERYTDRAIGGWTMPAGMLQAATPFFIATGAPLFAALWINLGRRGLDPSAPAKFGIALILMGLGFLVMAVASTYVVAGQKVAPSWLLFTYMSHAFGELCLGPVGLSAVTRLAPSRYVGQMLGLWFFAAAIGNNIAGQLAGILSSAEKSALPENFLLLMTFGILAGLAMLLTVPIVRRLLKP